jgi:hypothetical protein
MGKVTGGNVELECDLSGQIIVHFEIGSDKKIPPKLLEYFIASTSLRMILQECMTFNKDTTIEGWNSSSSKEIYGCSYLLIYKSQNHQEPVIDGKGNYLSIKI